MKHSKKSLKIVESITKKMDGETFHHHYHILYDIINLFPKEYNLNYVEIGCYAGGSACLVLQRNNTNVYSIDLGHPIAPEIVIKNIQKFNTNNNLFEYIQGNSQTQIILNKLKSFLNHIDVLFIDGDHSFLGVKKDFELYNPLVKSGGYIVFDDYNDEDFSPEVKLAVNEIIKNLNEYEIIGVLPNIFGARPKTLKEGNCFIIKKI
jgi:predicted O-methyltransferase YrrM